MSALELQWTEVAARIYYNPKVAYVYGFFLLANILVLLANVTVLHLPRHTLVSLETVLTLIFMFEVLLRMIVISDMGTYCRSTANLVDVGICGVCVWFCLLHHAPEWEREIDEVFANSLLLFRTLLQVARAVVLYRRHSARAAKDDIDFEMLMTDEEAGQGDKQ